MESEKELWSLNEVEIRILGALMEKSKTTPDYYPLTINSLTAACNQKSSRLPILDLSEEMVMNAVRSLKGMNLVSLSIGGTNRTNKFKHNFDIVYSVNNAEFAILCLLFLRGPLTPGELNSNSGRLHQFSSLSSVLETLLNLSERKPAFVKELSKSPGQKELRYIHLFGNESALKEIPPTILPAGKGQSKSDDSRIEKLENDLAEIKEKLEKIIRELGI